MNRRVVYLVATFGCVVAVGGLLFLGLRGNIVYFRTVSEAVHKRSDEGTRRFRLAGAVVPGSIAATSRGVRFRVTDGKATVAVDHTGDPPDLFKAGAPVVCEGRWGGGLTFDSDRILIKHGAEYRPPRVDTSKASARQRPGRPWEAEYRPPRVDTSKASARQRPGRPWEAEYRPPRVDTSKASARQRPGRPWEAEYRPPRVDTSKASS